STTFTPRHLTNLLLGLTCGSPAQAVETVTRYRDIPRDGPPEETVMENEEELPLVNALSAGSGGIAITSVTKPRYDLRTIFPDTLGRLFDSYIWNFAIETDEAARASLRKSEIVVVLGRWPWAEFVVRGLAGAG